MNYFTEKLPYIMGASMALIIGIIGLFSNSDKNVIYLSMLVCLVVFVIIGFGLRSIIKTFMANNQLANNVKLEEIEDEISDSSSVGSRIDIQANEDTTKNAMDSFYEEEFSPLKVSQVIRRNNLD